LDRSYLPLLLDSIGAAVFLSRSKWLPIGFIPNTPIPFFRNYVREADDEAKV